MKTRTDLRRDRIFKHIFHNHPRALIHLLNTFLPLTYPIVELEYMPEELHDDLGEGRLGIVDVHCRDTLGRTCIVEMQIRKIPMMEQRLLWNAARLLSRQPEMGGTFKGLQPVYTLCLLDHSLFDDQDDWIHHYHLQTSNGSGPIMQGLHFTFVEIRKWLEFGNFDKDDPKDAWMLFFTQPEAMKQIYTPEEKAKLKDMFEAVNAWDLTQYTETELLVMHKKIDIMLTTELVAEVSFGEGLQAGIEEGKQKGLSILKEAIDQIKLNPGISDDELINNYGLTPEDIKWIRLL